METVLFIAIMIFSAMLILVSLFIGVLIVWEYIKEWRWLNSYLERFK